MTRLEQLFEDSLTDEQRALYEAIARNREGVDARPRHLVGPDGGIRGPFGYMLHAPDVGGPLQELGGALRSRGTLDDLTREVVILMAAREQRCEFEWWAHVPIARAAGLTDDQLDAIQGGRVPSVEAAERVAVETAYAVITRGDLDDREYARALESLGTATLIELTTLIGYYTMAAVQLRVFRVGTPDAEPRAFDG